MAKNHGHSPAAWTSVSIMLLGSVIAGLGFVLEQWWVAIVGGAVILAGFIAGQVMHSMGLGSPRTPSHDAAELRETLEAS